MRKKEMIECILEDSKIHHNISINFNSIPNITEEDDFDWTIVSGDILQDFTDNMGYEKINDTGNRNLCSCRRYSFTKEDFTTVNNDGKKTTYSDAHRRWITLDEVLKNNWMDKSSGKFTTDGACKEHDLWHFYQQGRSGATLYWDKYWNETNMGGVFFTYDEDDLKEMLSTEVSIILKEIQWYNQKIKELMEEFYDQCHYVLKENRKERVEEEKKEKLYQSTLKVVKDNLFIKRLVSDTL